MPIAAACAGALCALLLGLAPSARAADWPTFDHDAARSGYAAGDGRLTTANVGRLRRRWRIALGAVADSTPIFLERVPAGGRTRAMLFQTATDGTTYGIDARAGRIVWRFATHGPKITTSTPVADPSGRALYVPGVDGFVRKLDAASGRELRGRGFPLRVTTMPETEKDASPLNVANGYLYAATSGYLGDATPYVGHVVTVRLSDGATHVFDALCSRDRALPAPSSCGAQRAGIWARAGVVADPDPSLHGRVYATTGNGDFDAQGGGANYGDTVLALSADGAQLAASYTPPDYASLESGDVDLGSTAPALLPRRARSRTPLLAVQGGKDGILRLLDRAHLRGVDDELQRVDLGEPLFSAPAVWTDAHARTWIYVGLGTRLRAYRASTDGTGRTQLVHAWDAPLPGPREGTSPIVAGGAVLIAGSGALLAFDGTTGRRLWSSAGPRAGGSIGAIHWQSPIAVDGWVYCADETGALTAYALP